MLFVTKFQHELRYLAEQWLGIHCPPIPKSFLCFWFLQSLLDLRYPFEMHTNESLHVRGTWGAVIFIHLTGQSRHDE
jgi:hypothetical protein